jgi:hypothetical protein
LRESLPTPEKHMIFAGDLVDPKVIDELFAKRKEFLGGIEIVCHVL